MLATYVKFLTEENTVETAMSTLTSLSKFWPLRTILTTPIMIRMWEW